MFDTFDSPASPRRLPLTALDHLTSDDNRHRLSVDTSSPNWRDFIPEGFETLSRLKKDYGCGLSINAMRYLLERGLVPVCELCLLVPPAENGGECDSMPASPDHEYKLLTSDRGKVTFDRSNRCVYVNGSRFSGLNPYVVTVFDVEAAHVFMRHDFMEKIEEVRPFVFRHPEFRGAESGSKGLNIDPTKVFRTFRVDVVKRESTKAEVA